MTGHPQESDTDDTAATDEGEADEEDEEEPLFDLGLTEEPDLPPAVADTSQGSTRDSRSPSAPPSGSTLVFFPSSIPFTISPVSPKIKPISLAELRRDGLKFSLQYPPRSYNVEAICAIPHPVPIHALAASACMTHLLTGSDDGYIRDYDIFTSVNSKTFLSAPQRHHAAVVEGLMKAGQLRYWWENPATHTPQPGFLTIEEEPSLAPVYSLAMHSDALWALAGTDVGLYLNTF